MYLRIGYEVWGVVGEKNDATMREETWESRRRN